MHVFDIVVYDILKKIILKYIKIIYFLDFFFILTSTHKNHCKTLKKFINLIIFEVKNIFKNHQKASTTL